ncbi:MAG: PRC-barrel domain-containing protein [Dehalococcoidales bacterium]|nr:PRC-barrel domain-containing protein [Dehalococcoidales bacterium]
MNETNISSEGPITVPKILDFNLIAKSSVTNDHGENLGKIDSVMLDLETGKLAYLVLTYGGFPNRTKFFAVPWELVKFSHHDKKLILNIPKDLVVKAPGYDSLEQLMQSVDFSWLGEVYEYYRNKTELDRKREEERKADVLKAQQRREEVKRMITPPSSGGNS